MIDNIHLSIQKDREKYLSKVLDINIESGGN
jgi:hypothetical protein